MKVVISKISSQVFLDAQTSLPLDLNGPTNKVFEKLEDLWIESSAAAIFRQIARRYPESTAIEDRDLSVSYRCLEQAVDRLSETISQIPSRSKAIGILLPNSLFHPVAMLACLAAGRVFVLLDILHPAPRVRELARNAAMDAVLVIADSAEINALLPAEVMRIDVSRCFEGPASVSAAPCPSDPDSPAAVLHTSGSSGQPKPVVVSQASLLQRVLQQVNACHIDPSDVLCPLSSPCTISGTREQLAALLTGATLSIVDPHGSSLAEMRRMLRQRRVSVIWAVPALLRAIVQADGPMDDFALLRVVRMGGDAVPWRDIMLLRQVLAPSCCIQISFGSTETPCLQWFVPRSFPAQCAIVPLGYPLEGVKVAALDKAGVSAPDGAIGEMVVSSRFVALGYWQDGACVAGPFKPMPDAPSIRTYATGDLVQRRQDGLYVCVGRKDRQVKIRGQRVDTSEIEAALRGVAGILDAAVIAVTSDLDTSLVAFVHAPDRHADPLRREIGLMLRTLPEVMRPPRLHIVPAVPRLPSAKLDLSRLREIDRACGTAAAADERTGSPSNSRMHQLVTQAWHKVLGPSGGGPTWSDAGGDSLGLLEFAALVERGIGRSLPLELLHPDMRLNELVAAIDRLVQPASDADGEDRRPLVFFFPGIEDDTPAQARFRQSLQEHVRFKVVQYPDWRTMVAQGGGMDHVVDLACAEILELPSHVPIRLAGYSFGAAVALVLASRLAAQDRRVAWLAVFDLDLAQFTAKPVRLSKTFLTLVGQARWSGTRGSQPSLARSLAQATGRAGVRLLLRQAATRRAFRPLVLRLPLPQSLSRGTDVELRWGTRQEIASAWFRGRSAIAVGVSIVLFRTDDHPDDAPFDLGWSAAGESVSVHWSDGGHLTMFWPPHSIALAEQFKQRLHSLDQVASHEHVGRKTLSE